MKFLTSRVVVSAIASFIAFAIVPAIATTPEVDFKTVTSKAYVDSLISNNDISGHKVNGVALSNANITLYGRSSTEAATAAKVVKVYNSAEGDVTIGALSTGMVIVVKPKYTATAAPTTLNVNSLGAKSMRYNGAAITAADAAMVWNKDNPSIWVYDGTYWNFAGGGKGADNLVWSTSETTSTNAYDTTFVGDTGATANAWPTADKTKLIDTAALANALALKQNKITTGLVSFVGADGTYQLPAIVRTNAAGDALTGNQLGIYDYATSVADDLVASVFAYLDPSNGYTSSDLDSFVPTLRIVAEESKSLWSAKQDKLPAKWVDTSGQVRLASAGGQTIELGSNAGSVAVRYITAGWLQPLTLRSGADNVILYINGTKTLDQFQTSNFGSTSTNNEKYINGALVSLELLKDVYGELNAKIMANSRPTGTAGTVVTYNGVTNGVQQFTETAIYNTANAYNASTDANKLATAGFVETKQNVLPAQASGAPVTIPTYPAYGTSDGVIGKMYLDTSSLYTTNNEHFPSSKLIHTTLSSYVPKSDALNTNDTNLYLADDNSAPSWATTNGVASLYRVPGVASGSNWAAMTMSKWANTKNVPTMDTLANSLAGLYDAVGVSVENRILNYDETSYGIRGASVPVPSQIEYTGESKLVDGNQLFWLPQLDKNGVQEATQVLRQYAGNKIVPTMDELAFALDGVLQTHETTNEWQEVVNFYGLTSSPLFKIANLLEASDENAMALYKSGYLQTFAPTLEALMNESAELIRIIDSKQDNLSGTNGNLVTYGATAGQTGSKAIATTITNNANTVPNTQAVYNAVEARQIKIPQAGRTRDASGALAFISDWTSASVKGTRLVTKTSSDGVVGERKIFEVGDTYTNDNATNIQIATIGAVMEKTFTKTCVEYRPGTTGETAANCWLWEIASNTVTRGTCSANGIKCSSNSDCCSNYCTKTRPGVCADRPQIASCAGEGESCSLSSCCDGLTCDSQSSTCVSNKNNNVAL